MKKSAKPKGSRHLDKRLFEAGLQCHKRLWLDYHEPDADRPSAAREQLSRVGDELRELARTAFPKAAVVDTSDPDAAAEQTRELLEQGAPVLFDATFVADGVTACCDVLVVHKDGEVDLFEIKAGTKVKHRYVNDLALQAVVLERAGRKLKRAYLLHINPKYAHKEGEPYPPMQLLRSADVTQKVEKQMPNVERRLQQLQLAKDDRASLELPMGTFCHNPFPCPHVARCRKDAPELPLHLLPELSRQQEVELHKEGIEELLAVPTDRPGLSFRQRRTIECQQEQKRLVEPFVREELRQCERPLHFVAIAATTEPLPLFDRQRPWQLTPYAWAAHTIHADGRVEQVTFARVDRDDPRGPLLKSLAQHVEVGGTILCWDDEPLREARVLLDSVPDEKASVRALLGFEHLDMKKLFEAGVFDPQLFRFDDFGTVVKTLLGDDSAREHEMLDPDARLEAVLRARAPRVRATTRDKIAGEITTALSWQAGKLAELFTQFAEVEEAKPQPKEKASGGARKPAKPLPPLPETD